MQTAQFPGPSEAIQSLWTIAILVVVRNLSPTFSTISRTARKAVIFGWFMVAKRRSSCICVYRSANGYHALRFLAARDDELTMPPRPILSLLLLWESHLLSKPQQEKTHSILFLSIASADT